MNESSSACILKEVPRDSLLPFEKNSLSYPLLINALYIQRRGHPSPLDFDILTIDKKKKYICLITEELSHLVPPPLRAHSINLDSHKHALERTLATPALLNP